MAEIPPEFCGVWRRESLSIQGSEPKEDSRVVWLQTSRGGFADVRVPIDPELGGEMAFAGHAVWSPPRMTFHRGLDIAAPGAPDVGTLTLDGDRMCERGVFVLGPRELPYEEIWVRQDPGPGGIWIVEGIVEQVSRGVDPLPARLIRVGVHAILVADRRERQDRFDAGHLRSGPDGRWAPEWAIRGSAFPTLPAEWPTTVGETLELGLADGWGVTTWTVRSFDV